MPSVILKQLFQVNNTQAQITSLALHQGQQHHQPMDIFSPIRPAIAPGTMDSIYHLIYMFYTIETNVLLLLGLSPATAFRMFPPLEQFPAGSGANFVIFMQCSSLSALLLRLLVELFAELFPAQHLDDINAGLLTVIFRHAAGNNSVLKSLFRFIRMWLFMASIHVMCFQCYQEPDILLFMAKGRALVDLL
ncbi:hypothetical protein TGAMA5MH_08956 [Trichoderma gamsii]|uniref:Uncharacterized protein n=1 Tax=Trichoderma gamsii TaxID=398673 RepID=A0A2K0T0Q3_9HYPO|nr:hypothetical protein TGAMA5MH_08956 [Trichoderma gamsii]